MSLFIEQEIVATLITNHSFLKAHSHIFIFLLASEKVSFSLAISINFEHYPRTNVFHQFLIISVICHLRQFAHTKVISLSHQTSLAQDEKLDVI